jgi:hypothetical protein
VTGRNVPLSTPPTAEPTAGEELVRLPFISVHRGKVTTSGGGGGGVINS